MIGAPWYLLALGIGFVIVGFFVDGFRGLSGKRQSSIHHRMRDEDIVKSLNQREAASKGSVFGLLGAILIFISILWRLLASFI